MHRFADWLLRWVLTRTLQWESMALQWNWFIVCMAVWHKRLMLNADCFNILDAAWAAWLIKVTIATRGQMCQRISFYISCMQSRMLACGHVDATGDKPFRNLSRGDYDRLRACLKHVHRLCAPCRHQLSFHNQSLNPSIHCILVEMVSFQKLASIGTVSSKLLSLAGKQGLPKAQRPPRSHPSAWLWSCG